MGFFAMSFTVHVFLYGPDWAFMPLVPDHGGGGSGDMAGMPSGQGTVAGCQTSLHLHP